MTKFFKREVKNVEKFDVDSSTSSGIVDRVLPIPEKTRPTSDSVEIKKNDLSLKKKRYKDGLEYSKSVRWKRLVPTLASDPSALKRFSKEHPLIITRLYEINPAIGGIATINLPPGKLVKITLQNVHDGSGHVEIDTRPLASLCRQSVGGSLPPGSFYYDIVLHGSQFALATPIILQGGKVEIDMEQDLCSYSTINLRFTPYVGLTTFSRVITTFQLVPLE